MGAELASSKTTSSTNLSICPATHVLINSNSLLLARRPGKISNPRFISVRAYVLGLLLIPKYCISQGICHRKGWRSKGREMVLPRDQEVATTPEL